MRINFLAHFLSFVPLSALLVDHDQTVRVANRNSAFHLLCSSRIDANRQADAVTSTKTGWHASDRRPEVEIKPRPNSWDCAVLDESTLMKMKVAVTHGSSRDLVTLIVQRPLFLSVHQKKIRMLVVSAADPVHLNGSWAARCHGTRRIILQLLTSYKSDSACVHSNDSPLTATRCAALVKGGMTDESIVTIEPFSWRAVVARLMFHGKYDCLTSLPCNIVT